MEAVVGLAAEVAENAEAEAEVGRVTECPTLAGAMAKGEDHLAPGCGGSSFSASLDLDGDGSGDEEREEAPSCCACSSVSGGNMSLSVSDMDAATTTRDAVLGDATTGEREVSSERSGRRGGVRAHT